jgi:hypothetical protein
MSRRKENICGNEKSRAALSQTDESAAGLVQERSTQWPEHVMGAKYVRLLEKQLRSLRDENLHGNRELFLDDVFVVYLLAFFNPVVRSLRTVEDLSQTRQAQPMVEFCDRRK